MDHSSAMPARFHGRAFSLRVCCGNASIALDGREARFRPSQESQPMDFDARSRDTATASGPSAARPDASSGRIGVLLLNLGTPDGTDYRSMRRYLAEFLSDRRVIETNRAIWYPILHGI